jgi:predicted O-methyltransferase YrrM
LRQRLTVPLFAGLDAALQANIRRVGGAESPDFRAAWQKTEAVPGWFSQTAAVGFWAAVSDVRPRTVVEIGSYMGRSTTFLGLAVKALCPSPQRVVSIDPHSGDRQHLEALGLQSIPSLDMFHLHTRATGVADILTVKVMTSDEAATQWEEPIDLLYIDGWHAYEAVRSDARNFASRLTQDGLVCVDDYGTYAEVRAAFDEAAADLGLTVYGTIMAQAWAGRRAEAPPRLRATLRAASHRSRVLRVKLPQS